jgi:hypothetical protein
MEPVTYTAIVALVIALGSLAVSFSVYKKSKRDAFIQRRDRLSQMISDLNVRITETHLISARYEIVAVKRAGLPLSGEQAEQNTAQIASIKRMREAIEVGLKSTEETIEKLYFIYSKLILETGAAKVEQYITLVQVLSNDLKKVNDRQISSLHILETTTQIIETDDQIKQMILDFERRMKDQGLST